MNKSCNTRKDTNNDSNDENNVFNGDNYLGDSDCNDEDSK